MNKIFLRSFTVIILICFQSISAFTQNCSNTSVGFTPINDLGKGYYRSHQGGHYPDGSNLRPADHLNAGLEIANNILPLDTAGNYDPVSGKIVLLSVGMSNCSQEFQAFITSLNGDSDINPKLRVINGAQGGQTIDIIINPNANFWTVIDQRLASQGLTVKQVQAVWFKEAQSGPTDTSFPGYPVSLKDKFNTAMGVMKSKYLNLKQCFLANRIYAGYATSGLNPEPYAYYSGWSVKWLIEDQINGDTSLIYSGINSKSPWLSWGPDLWADGTVPRSDSLTWNCPTDYSTDGTHPSPAGRQKVADMLIDFFKNDETTKPWFLKSVTINLTASIQGFYNVINENLNMRDTVFLYLRSATSPYNVHDYSKAVLDSVNFRGIYKFYITSTGNYYLQTKHRNSIETWSKNGGQFIINGNIYNYNFTDSANKAYGNNLILTGNKYSIYSGDTDQNGIIDVTDNALTDNAGLQFSQGYIPEDVNGDLIVDLSDLALVNENASEFIVKITP
ncbi:MAG: hypothetical protein WAT71_04395 [Ignavibacteria bacterium]